MTCSNWVQILPVASTFFQLLPIGAKWNTSARQEKTQNFPIDGDSVSRFPMGGRREGAWLDMPCHFPMSHKRQSVSRWLRATPVYRSNSVTDAVYRWIKEPVFSVRTGTVPKAADMAGGESIQTIDGWAGICESPMRAVPSRLSSSSRGIPSRGPQIHPSQPMATSLPLMME